MTYISTQELFKAFYTVKKRPGMFLYPLTLSSLGNYINGYRLCCTLNAIHQGEDDFLEKFRIWLLDCYGMEHTNRFSWWGIVLENGFGDGPEALDEFYMMLGRYLEELQIMVPDV